jgi:hypothetical protein
MASGQHRPSEGPPARARPSRHAGRLPSRGDAIQLNPQLASDDFVRPAALFSLAVAALFAGDAMWNGLARRTVSIYAALGGLGVAGCFAAMAIGGLWGVLAVWVVAAGAIGAILVLERRRTR